MATLYDIVVPHYEYELDDGTVKTRWMNIGRIIETTSGSLKGKLDCIPIQVCVPSGDEREQEPWEGWFHLFETKPKSPSHRAPEPDDVRPDDVPF
jgi:hypothetical protein